MPLPTQRLGKKTLDLLHTGQRETSHAAHYNVDFELARKIQASMKTSSLIDLWIQTLISRLLPFFIPSREYEYAHFSAKNSANR